MRDNQKLANVLLAEDQQADIEYIRMKMKFDQIQYNMHIAKDGEQVLDFLCKRNEHQNAVTVDLLLLDVNLPKKNARDILTAMNGKEVPSIPTLILSGSDNEDDKEDTQALGAIGYIVKPFSLEKLESSLQTEQTLQFRKEEGVTVLYKK